MAPSKPRGADFTGLSRELSSAALSFTALASSASAFGATLNLFKEYERQLTLTNSVAGGTAVQFEAMNVAARQFALATITSATESASALYFLASAGFSVEQSLSAMNGVLLLSQATLSDVSFTSDVIASNLRAFQLQASDATRVSNVFAAAIAGSQASMDKLAFAFRQVGPVAQVANLSIEETTALLGQLFNIGLRGEQAGTGLRNIIVRLANPVGEARDILQEFGIATLQANGEVRDFMDIISDLDAANLTDANLAKVFGTEALAAGVALLRSSRGSFQDFRDEITGTNAAFEIAVEQMDTLDGATKRMRNAFSELAIQTGENLAPIIQSLAITVTELVIAFTNLDPSTQSAITTFAALGITIFGLVPAVSSLARLFFGPFFKGVSGATKAVKSNSTAMKALTTVFGGSVKVLKSMTGLLSNFGLAILGSVGPLRNLAAGLSFLLPGGLVVRGIGLLVGALVGGGSLAGAWAIVEAASRKASVAMLEAVEIDVASQIDAIIPQEDLTNLERRLEEYNKQIEAANQVFFGRGFTQVDRASALSPTTESLENELAEIELARSAITELLPAASALEFSIQELNTEYSELESRLHELSDDTGGDERRNIKTRLFEIENIFNFLSEEQRAELLELELVRDELNKQIAEFDAPISDIENLIRESTESRNQALIGFVEELASPSSGLELGGALEGAGRQVKDALSDTDVKAQFLAILTSISDTGSGITPDDLQNALVEATGGEDAQNEITAALAAAAEDNRAKLSLSVESATAGFSSINDDIAKAYLEARVRSGDDLADALAASEELATINLVDKIENLVGDYADELEAIGPIVNQLIEGQEQTLLSIINASDAAAFLEDAGVDGNIDADDQAALDNLLIENRAKLIAALENSSFADMLPEGAVDAILAANAEVLASIRGTTDLALNVELPETQANIRNRFSRSGGGGGRGAKTPEELKRDLQEQLEEFRQATRDATRSFAENSLELSIGDRVDILLELDTADVLADYGEQLRDLAQDFEKSTEALKGQPGALQELTKEYDSAVEAIERARDADLAYTDSFEENIQRRSDAVTAMNNAIATTAINSGSIFAQFSAGIQVAANDMALEAKNVFEITRDAAKEFAGVLTTTLGDLIFDSENALENFKASMLSLSRSIFEQFTQGFIAQGAGFLAQALSGGGGVSIPGFAQGGEVRGKGTGTSDSLLARLSNGEFVMPASVTQEFLPLLESLRAGNGLSELFSYLPRYMEGGLVSTSGMGRIGSPQPVAAGETHNRSMVNTTNVTYNIRTNDPSGFRRSASQHARVLGGRLESSKKDL